MTRIRLFRVPTYMECGGRASLRAATPLWLRELVTSNSELLWSAVAERVGLSAVVPIGSAQRRDERRHRFGFGNFELLTLNFELRTPNTGHRASNFGYPLTITITITITITTPELPNSEIPTPARRSRECGG